MYVTYAHELMGNKALRGETPMRGAFAQAVADAAEQAGATLVTPHYQAERLQAPNVDIMLGMFEQSYRHQLRGVSDTSNWYLDPADEKFKDIQLPLNNISQSRISAQNLWIGAGMGAFIMFNTMFNAMRGGTADLRDMIMYRPVYDFAWTLHEQLGPKLVEALMADINKSHPLPVQSVEGRDLGTFAVNGWHLADPYGLPVFRGHEMDNVIALHKKFRLISDFKEWEPDEEPDFKVEQIRHLQIVTVEGDPISPPSLARTFAQFMAPFMENPIEIVVLESETDHAAWMAANVKAKLAKGWGRSYNNGPTVQPFKKERTLAAA